MHDVLSSYGEAGPSASNGGKRGGHVASLTLPPPMPTIQELVRSGSPR